MKRPLQHRIDEEAQRLMMDAIPSSWVVNPYTKDYAKDYEVEIGDSEDNLTGHGFVIQLKGVKRVHELMSRGTFSFPFQTNHLKYYVDKVQRPVFLVVADLKVKSVYWQFLQQYVHTHLSKVDWRKQGTIAIHIPVTNLLANTKEVIAAVHNAERFMRDRYPSTLSAALEEQRRKLIRLDPRFDPQIRVENGQTHVTFNAKESVEGSLRIRGKPTVVRRKIADLVERGKSVRFKQGELEIIGSPLFNEVMNEIVSMQIQKSLPVDVSFGTVLDEKNILCLGPLRGDLTGGTHEMRWSYSIGNDLFRVSVRLSRGDSTSCMPVLKASWTINPSEWVGNELAALPHFQALHTFITTIADGNPLTIEMSHNGRAAIATRSKAPKLKVIHDLRRWFDVIERARFVARHWNINTTLQPLTELEVQTIDELYDLARSGHHQRPGKGFSVCFSYREFRPGQLSKKVEPADIALTSDNSTATLMGKSFALGPVSTTLTRAVIVEGPRKCDKHAGHNWVKFRGDHVLVKLGQEPATGK